MAETYVEFFSSEALENVMVMLKYKPDRIIFIGHKHNMITKKINSLTRFAKTVAPGTSLEFVEVSRDDLDQITGVLEELCDKYPDCQFELTGGGELIFIALGFVSAKRSIKTLRIDPFTNTEIDCSGKTPVCIHSDIRMTVAENMILHGGALTNQTGSSSTWHFTEDFRQDIRAIWKIASNLQHKWNRYCSAIEEVMKNCPPDDDGFYTLPLSGLGEARNLFLRLYNIHVISDYTTNPRSIRFRFKNNMIRHIITKTGNILELHVYEVATRDHESFTDAVIGAVIDWDGQTHAAKQERENAAQTKDTGSAVYPYRPSYDTVNEIDVILMRDVIPTFISCKSGKAGSLALHELQTVTSRFGGEYAKKALVMASPCDNSASGASFFKQRAKDMHIWVIDNVYNMSDEALLAKLQRIQGP